jgi:outer membrane protein assembly factor BamB
VTTAFVIPTVKSSIASVLLAVLGSVAMNFAAAPQGNWPQFRGPHGAGVAPDDKAGPVEFGPEKNVVWKAALPGGNSSPCVWWNRIFVTGHDRDRKKLETICLDRTTGKILWRKDAPAEKFEKVHAIGSAASSTPVTDGKAVYSYFGSCGLVAYDFEGAVLWEKSLPMAKTFRNFGTGTSPILASDKIILDMHLDGDSHLLAVQTSDGKTAWTAPKPDINMGWSTPVVWSEGGDEIVGILNAGRFTAHDLKTGAERWWITGLPSQICATPVVSDGVLFLNGTGVLGNKENLLRPPPFDEMITKYDANKDGQIAADEIPEKLLVADRGASDGAGDMTLRQAFGMMARGQKALDRPAWEEGMKGLNGFLEGDMMKTSALAVRTGGKQDATAMHVIWTELKGVPEVPSPLLYRNRAYYIKNGGLLTCRNAKSGEALYEERVGAPGGYYASPIAGGGKIYLASDRGTVTVLEAGDKLQVVRQTDFGEKIMATPALVDGKFYVRTAKHLYAF